VLEERRCSVLSSSRVKSIGKFGEIVLSISLEELEVLN